MRLCEFCGAELPDYIRICSCRKNSHQLSSQQPEMHSSGQFVSPITLVIPEHPLSEHDAFDAQDVAVPDVPTIPQLSTISRWVDEANATPPGQQEPDENTSDEMKRRAMQAGSL